MRRPANEFPIEVEVKVESDELRIRIKQKQKVSQKKQSDDKFDTVKWSLKGGLGNSGVLTITGKTASFPFRAISAPGTAVTASDVDPNAADGSYGYTVGITGKWGNNEDFKATIDPDIVIDENYAGFDGGSNAVLVLLDSVDERLAAMDARLTEIAGRMLPATNCDDKE